MRPIMRAPAQAPAPAPAARRLQVMRMADRDRQRVGGIRTRQIDAGQLEPHHMRPPAPCRRGRRRPPPSSPCWGHIRQPSGPPERRPASPPRAPGQASASPARPCSRRSARSPPPRAHASPRTAASSRCNCNSRIARSSPVEWMIPFATWASRDPETSITPQPRLRKPGSIPITRILPSPLAGRSPCCFSDAVARKANICQV